MEELTYVRVNGGTPSGCMIVIELPSVEDMGAERVPRTAGDYHSRYHIAIHGISRGLGHVHGHRVH